MDSVELLEKSIKQSNLLNKYMLERIGVFGSFARGKSTNDIDFMYMPTIANWLI